MFAFTKYIYCLHILALNPLMINKEKKIFPKKGKTNLYLFIYENIKKYNIVI